MESVGGQGCAEWFEFRSSRRSEKTVELESNLFQHSVRIVVRDGELRGDRSSTSSRLTFAAFSVHRWLVQRLDRSA